MTWMKPNRVVWSPELEQIFGLDPGEFSQREEDFFELIHPEDREIVRDAVMSAIETATRLRS